MKQITFYISAERILIIKRFVLHQVIFFVSTEYVLGDAVPVSVKTERDAAPRRTTEGSTSHPQTSFGLTIGLNTPVKQWLHWWILGEAHYYQ